MKIFNPIYRNKQMVGSLILCVIRDLRFDNVPFGRTQFAPTLWTKSVTVGAQCLRPPSAQVC